jgi:formylmethanofuran dehydrogenase subunit E
MAQTITIKADPKEGGCFKCDHCAEIRWEGEAVSLGNGELVCVKCADGKGTPEFNENDLPEGF